MSHLLDHNNLVDTWLAVMHAQGYSKTQSVQLLNDNLKTRYTLSRINEWKSKTGRQPALPAYQYMLNLVLPVLIDELLESTFEVAQPALNEQLLDKLTRCLAID